MKEREWKIIKVRDGEWKGNEMGRMWREGIEKEGRKEGNVLSAHF